MKRAIRNMCFDSKFIVVTQRVSIMERATILGH